MPFNGNQTINRQRLGFTIKRKCGFSYCWNCNKGFFCLVVDGSCEYFPISTCKKRALEFYSKRKPNLTWIKALLNTVLLSSLDIDWGEKKYLNHIYRIFLFGHHPCTHFWIKPLKKTYFSNITIIFLHSNLTANGARLLSAIWYGLSSIRDVSVF